MLYGLYECVFFKKNCEFYKFKEVLCLIYPQINKTQNIFFMQYLNGRMTLGKNANVCKIINY